MERKNIRIKIWGNFMGGNMRNQDIAWKIKAQISLFSGLLSEEPPSIFHCCKNRVFALQK